MRIGCSARLGSIVMMLIATCFVIIGIGTGIFGTRAARAEAERAARLPLATARDIERSSIGAEVIFEGAIDARNPTRFRNFVAYIREEYRGSDDDGDERWEVDERWTPPLLIATSDGLVQVANDTYRLERPRVGWQESESLGWSFLSGGTKRYQGFASGNSVLVIGRVVSGVEGRAVEAEVIFGGTRSEYIESQQMEALLAPIVGIVFGGLGAALLLGGIRSFFRG